MKKKTQNKINASDLKKELVEDLDQFLLDSEIAQEDIDKEKQKALAELDKLIKQDLTYSQILKSIKKDVEERIEEVEVSDEEIYSRGKSAHILNLKQELEKKQVQQKKTSFFDRKLLSSISLSRPKKEEIPKIEVKEKNTSKKTNFSKLNISMAFSRAMIFAVVLALILFPIRAVVFWGQVKEDKGKIIDFGQEGFISLKSGVISASENSYQEAQVDFENALANFSQAQEVLDDYQEWMLSTAGFMPLIGKPISLSRNMLSVATNISEAASILNQKLQSQGDPTEYIVLINAQLEKTLPYLEQANQDLEGISTINLPENFRDYFESLKAYLPSTIENLKDLNSIFSLATDLLGHESEKRYVVLFQNNNEIRPTGGFIGSFALFDIYNGKIVNLEIPKGGLYDLEAGQKTTLKAPQALSLINSDFNIWDANWWYDFPTSAKKIIWFYQQAGASSLDGVIAINANVLSELLYVLGPVTLDEYGVTIDHENIFDVLQEEVELNYDKEANEPKAIIADLVPVVLKRLLSNVEKQKDIVGVFAKTLASKDIQIYSQNSETQEILENFGWAGQMLEYNKDYLAVISTNIAGGKTDNNIYQEIDHQANISENGEIINTIKITRTNRGPEDYIFAGIYGGNASYLRVYTPLGSEFIEAVGFDDIPDNYFRDDANAQIDKDLASEEIKMIDNHSSTEIFTSLGKTVFANWMTLAPGETKTALIKYKLPFKLDFGDPLVNNWQDKIFKRDVNLDNYSLVVQSQSGAKNTIFSSSVILPENVRLVYNNSSDNQNINITNDLLTFTKKLDQDQYFGFILANK